MGTNERAGDGLTHSKFFVFLAVVFTMALGLFYLMVAGHVTAAPVVAGPTVDVSIQGFAFDPAIITVTAGTTVRWTNNQDLTFIDHTSSSDITDTLSAAYWDSGLLAHGQTFSRTFNTPGVFAYHCNVHITMHGTVVVLSKLYLPLVLDG
ncbi:MAG TPA: plastocyanin/azurin family copper-binding protein [Anaerolineae bacterium]